MKKDTSWQTVHNWYDEIVGPQGHYYHKAIILPKTLQLLNLHDEARLLDLACGQGVLARAIPRGVSYTGIDLSPSLIQAAKNEVKKAKCNTRQFLVGDITTQLPLAPDALYSHAAIILALQNIERPEMVFAQLKKHLEPKARFVIVMNHPCYRIPRQSHWGVDPISKLQYRRINLYMSPQKIPIHMNPGTNNDTKTTWSFHHPLSSYCAWLKQNSFMIETIEEWCSDKTSTGLHARSENRARKEFPLFLAIVAQYLTY